jgi:hypothetical protein
MAQVGIGTTTPNANAALDVVSTSQGMLFPRMTTAQRNAIVSPAKGLTIFNTTLNSIQTNIGTSSAANWKNWAALIDPSTNGTAIVSAYTCSTASAGAMRPGVAVSGVTQTITATVTTVGTYSISTTANGVTFAGSGTFAGTGAQTIVLTASGTPTAAGSNSFTLNTTPNCSFSRTTNPAPLPANITLSAIGPYFVASVYDQDYLPYTAPTAAASLATAQAADGTNEAFILDIQGSLTTTGVTIQIPYTVSSGTVSLPAFTQTINVPASFTEDNIARDVTFSYGAGATLSLTGSGRINATLLAVGGTLNAKKLDIQTGIGNDYLGWLLAQFIYATNSSGGTANFQFRNIAPIPDRNIADANHRMFYVPVSGLDGRTWLNNNLGANYANTAIPINGGFNPTQQATGTSDANAHGSLFQWGRYSDGHEFRNSVTTTGPIATPWISTNFMVNSPSPWDWRTPQDVNLWQGASGTNNPCPIGFRIPTLTELTNQRSSWSTTNSAGAHASPLKLTLTGERRNGTIGSTNAYGSFWSSSVSSTKSSILYLSSMTANLADQFRYDACVVRCIAAGHPSTDGIAVVSGYTCSTTSTGTLTAGNAVSGVTQTITANVTTVGTYIITATANGVTFAASGTFAGTGAQNIVLTASGTPLVNGANTFTLNTTPNCNFSRTTLVNPSSNGTGVVSAYICNTASAVAMTAGVTTTGTGLTQTITATVGTAGTYSISTTTANGVTFAGAGTFAGTGAQNIVLNATGTPTAAGSHSFTLNTTPNCIFSRTTLAPLPANISLSAIGAYFVASVNDLDYLPYTAPTAAASLATAQAANGTNESFTLNVQGALTTTGVTLKIPYTVVTAAVSLPAFTQTINVPASFTQDNITRNVTFSYAAATLGVGSGTINATLQASGGTLNAKKLDLQTGIGNDNLGWLLAQFTYATNNNGGSANFQFRNIAAIPDRNIADANHVMFYMPVLGADGKTWLNNNLGANYANTSRASFNPVSQASSSTDQNAYGSLFQWGRGADGHELINWTSSSAGSLINNTTTTLSTADVTGNANFILIASSPYDWRNPQNDNLWQGLSGTNNPCPIGYNLPTNVELDIQRTSWTGGNNAAGALASSLKLPMAGYCDLGNGSLINVGTEGLYRSSSINSTETRSLFFNSSSPAGSVSGNRAFGFPLRCIANDNPSNGTAIVSEYTCSTASAGTMNAGVAVSGVTQTITATVTTVGTYSISTTTANGITFAGSGTFAGTGAQTIVLTATGTPTAAGTHPFTLNTTPNCSFSRTTTNPSTNGNAVVSSYTCTTASAGSMTAGVSVSGVTQTITATVTTVGTYSISTTANGVTFAGSGTFAGTGAQTIVLTATGTPSAEGSYSFALNTAPNCTFSRISNQPSTNGEAVVSGYVSTSSAGQMRVHQAVSGVTQTITATVTTVGTYSISSTAANGVTFAGSGTFASTGAQTIVLTASGTPTALGNNSFTLNTTPNCNFSRTTLVNPSSNGTAVVSSYNCTTATAGTMTTGTAVSGVTQTITATVTTVGSYSISTTANGVTFASSGNFAGTGAQTIVLNAIGTPTITSSPYSYTLNTTPNCSFSRTVINSSSNGTGVVSAYTCTTASAGLMKTTINTSGTGVTQTITATVTTVGTYSISAIANGVTFEGTGTFAGTGAQTIVLTAAGTPTALGSHLFTLNTTPNCNFSRSTNQPSTNGTAVVSGYVCTSASAGTMTAGTPVSGVTQTITATVTTVGTYSISTTANGVTFAASGTFAGTGAQTIVLTATGTPTYGTTDAFTLNTTPNCSFSRTAMGNASSNGTAVVSGYTCSTASAGTMLIGTPLSGVTQTITATVTTVGTYSISTTTANGVTFAASGAFAGTGAQTIVLTATGTPTAVGSHSFTLNTTPNCNFSRTTTLHPSTNGTGVVSAYNCSTGSAGTMRRNVAVTGVSQTITATVTTVGTYSISTTNNGVTFAASGTFAGTGAQTIVLTATGTPTCAFCHSFTLNTTPSCSFGRNASY